ncbi:hypothetical protein N2152v2_009720 [Parachlorella kessleri]
MQVLRKFSTSLRERAVIATSATPGFTPTSNDRCARGFLMHDALVLGRWGATADTCSCCSNRAMLEEAGAFSLQMRRMEQDLRTLSQAAQVAVETTLHATAAPLPTVYHTTKAGSAALAAPTGVVRKPSLGVGYGFDGFSVVVEEHHKRLADALEAMADWQGAYAAPKVDCRAVEEMRRGADYRLVQVSSLQSKVCRLEAKVAELSSQPEKTPGEGDRASSSAALTKAQDSLEGLQFTLHHKEAKLALAAEQYKQAEEELYCRLVGLLVKASEFRNLAALALNLAASLLTQTSRKVDGSQPEAAVTMDTAALGPKVTMNSNPLYSMVASA